MPWAPVCRPSIALGILSAIADEKSVTCETLYPGFDLVDDVGHELYSTFAFDKTTFGLSEHLFACDLFGPSALQSDAFVEASVSIGVLRSHGVGLTDLRVVRDSVIPNFLDRLTEQVIDRRPDIVGFSCPFNQVLASLALAKRLKARKPDTKTVFGGAGFDDEMGREYQRALPGIVDHVFLGEAENTFRQYLDHLKGDGSDSLVLVDGVTAKDGRDLETVAPQTVSSMDVVPTPDYSAYFTAKHQYEATAGRHIKIDWLPFESARGCWWGERSQCSFCGIIGTSMSFRARPVERVVEEILTLAQRHRTTKLLATDWIISRTERTAIFERLAELSLDLEIFYETKSDLTPAEIKLMCRAGVTHVQPGIESFSTPVLKLMRKGSTGLRQIAFLKHATRAGLNLYYNLLYGLPGENPDWYTDMAALIPAVSHLQPPMSNVHPVEVHRFSPLFNACRAKGKELRIRNDYRYNYPPGSIALEKIGYFFEADTLPKAPSYLEMLETRVAAWIAHHQTGRPPHLVMRKGPGFAVIEDTRFERAAEYELDPFAVALLESCDSVVSWSHLHKEHNATDKDTLNRALDALQSTHLLMREGSHYLSLPLWASSV